jgi:hypothetical protein
MALSRKELPPKKSIIRLRKIITAPAPRATAVSFVKLNRKKLFIEASCGG